MKTIFLDTSFIVALANERDQDHARATALAIRYANHRLLTTDAVLLEIGNSLARRFRSAAIAMIEQLRSSPDVQVLETTVERFEAAFALYKQHADKEWSLVDCISFEVMRRAEIDAALTFDQHFIQAGFRALMRENP